MAYRNTSTRKTTKLGKTLRHRQGYHWWCIEGNGRPFTIEEDRPRCSKPRATAEGGLKTEQKKCMVSLPNSIHPDLRDDPIKPGLMQLTRYRQLSRVRLPSGSEWSPRCTAAGSPSCPSTGPCSAQVRSDVGHQRSGKSPVHHNRYRYSHNRQLSSAEVIFSTRNHCPETSTIIILLGIIDYT